MTSICYSGGAKPHPGFFSADLVFGECAEAAKHMVIHFSFNNHRHGQQSYIKLTEDQLKEADPFLLQANKIIKRTYPTSSDHTNKLLQRNYHQIKDTLRVYAVSEFDEKGIVKGGTAWAVYMAINKGIPVYLFNQSIGKWFMNDGSGGWIIMNEDPPKPERRYTGIGTRRMLIIGWNVIRGLYGMV